MQIESKWIDIPFVYSDGNKTFMARKPTIDGPEQLQIVVKVVIVVAS